MVVEVVVGVELAAAAMEGEARVVEVAEVRVRES